MKRIIIGLVVSIVCVLGIIACKDDFSLNGNYQESAIVVGILDQTDSVHYVKITRSFIGDGQTSSLTIAQIADSSYFKQVAATVKEKDGNGNVIRTFTLHDTIIPNKDVNGVFYAPDQKVYVFYTNPSSPLNPAYTYHLDINIDNGRIKVAGETELVDGIVLTNLLTNFNSSLKFADNVGTYKTQAIDVTNTGNSTKVNCKLRFEYREYTSYPTIYTDKSINWSIGEVDLSPGTTTHQFGANGEAFYKLIKDKIAIDPAVEQRKYLGIEINITGGATELGSYIAVNQPSSNLAQNKPDFTNLTVNEGFKVIGIFSARHKLVKYKPAVDGIPQVRAMDQKSVRELCNGPITGMLGFCSDHTADNNPNNPSGITVCP